MARDAVGDERLHMRRQVAHSARPAPTSELAEGERDRDTTPDALGAIALVDQPGHVRLNLSGDPRTPRIRSIVAGLTKYRSNMDNFLSPGESEEAPCRQTPSLCGGGR